MLPDDDGKWNGQESHSNICHSQRHDEQVSDILQVGVETHCPADQDVPEDSQDGDHHLQDNISQLDMLQHVDVLLKWLSVCFHPTAA